MGLVSTTIPNLVNGVSQQPYALRLASQCEEQVNGHSSVVEGLRKRPGTRHLAKLNGVPDDAYIHVINRDRYEQYVVALTADEIKVFDIEGNEKQVQMDVITEASNYLGGTTRPSEDYRCVTVADYTFVLNTKRVVKASGAIKPKRPPEALVWIRQGSYGATYSVSVNGVEVASYTVPNGSDASHATKVTTDNIATELKNDMDTAIGESFDIEIYGSTLWLKRKDDADFTISSEDSIGDNGMEVIKNQIQRFSSLPARAVNGFTVEVVGDQTSAFDNYYVVYDDSESGEQSGVWKESIKGGEEYAFNKYTMPHALVRESDGTFRFKAIDWVERKVGDLDSNPFPSFLGRTIKDIFFHRNRLGFISDENVVFSKAGDYFNFFIGTATAVLDDDPIDIGVSHTKVSILRHAIPFNETLLLFSDKTQFQLGATDVLTPDTVSINQTTEYECSLRAKPVGVGRYVYFAVNRGTYTGIREYYTDGESESEEAAEVTGHVPKYIPGGVFKIASSGNEDMLAVLTDGSPNEVFVYKFYWSGTEKLQASWSKWRFGEGDKILNCEFIESKLYFIIKRHDGVHLEVMDLEPGAVEDNWNIHVHLDSKVKSSNLALEYLENDPDKELDNQTVVTLPYKLDTGETVQVITAPGGSRDEGIIFTQFSVDNAGEFTKLTLSGDWRGQPFFVGKPYEFRYRFSTMVIKEESVGGGQMTIGEGRIQLRKVTLLYNDTGYFRVEVTPFRRDTYRYIFSGRVVGSGENLIGRVPIEQGRFRFPVSAKNDQVTIELVNDSFLPCFFLSAEWEAFYSIRSQRL